MIETASPTGAVALVTGANKGIGFQTALQLAERGLTVVVGARAPERGKAAADEIRATGADAHPVTLDVTDPAIVRQAARWIDERFGRLDVLVNNAGTAEDPGHRPSAADLDLVRGIFETNVFGVLTVTNALLPLLRRSVAPRIVNVSSGMGSLTTQSSPESYLAQAPATAAYPASKSALNALTVQYAKELGQHGFLVNAVTPGPCDTDLTKELQSAGFAMTRTAAQGAAVIVRLATLGPDGPTGGFFGEDGPLPW
ncbi:SDR family oxidoreductase [Kitasatospora sp. RB6PN24]|uniref:SDR family oxidoreductase n=1 Tax=Kitasatospora humi TaxID=2893891 RepID=UPI001E3CFCED|nr:SDR family oxidoreductase [Kitasatospora humi]MCC9309498.1 SDR family oxidoreductase [Kitasatospora humi]